MTCIPFDAVFERRTRILWAEHGAGTEEAEAFVEEMYEAVKDAGPAAFDDVHDRFAGRTEKRVEELKSGPSIRSKRCPSASTKARS